MGGGVPNIMEFMNSIYKCSVQSENFVRALHWHRVITYRGITSQKKRKVFCQAPVSVVYSVSSFQAFQVAQS